MKLNTIYNEDCLEGMKEDDMAERMRQEKDRLYNDNIRLVREIKELGGN